MQSRVSIGQVMVKVRSAKQIEASRQNGLKAQGAVSQEGKTRSSMNAIKHGGYAERFVPLGQNPQEYYEYARQAEEYWQPENLYEKDLVRQYISYGWKLQLHPILENALLGIEILDYQSKSMRLDFRQTRKIEKKYLLDGAKVSLNKSDELLAISYSRNLNGNQTLISLEEVNTRTFAKFHKVVELLQECQKRRGR